MKKIVFLLILLFVPVLRAAAVSEEALRMEELLHAIEIPAREDMLPAGNVPVPEWNEGDEKDFIVTDPASGKTTVCRAAVLYKETNAVFWLDIDRSAKLPHETSDEIIKIDTQVIPLMRDTFGMEANPGVDNDPLLHVLFTPKIGIDYLGYFASENAQDPSADPNSNGMELIILNTVLLSGMDTGLSGTFAHEFEHMIHHAHDGNEELFVDEGLAELAAALVYDGYPDPLVRNWLCHTDSSLIRWPVYESAYAYYGNAFLFMQYIYEKYGRDGIRALINEESAGADGIDRVFPEIGFDGLFLEWNSLLLSELFTDEGDGYTQYQIPTQGIPPDITNLYPAAAEGEHKISHYGFDFYRINCTNSPCTIVIEHSPETPILSFDLDGEKVFWSNAVENADTVLEYAYDLRDAAPDTRLDYDIHYNIEGDLDHLYLYIRDEAGETMLRNYTWSRPAPIHERISLSEWAGKEITVRFVYSTDTATLAEGALISDCSVSSGGALLSAGDTLISGWVPFVNRVPLYIGSVFSDGKNEPQSIRSGADEAVIWECDGICTFSVSAMSRYARVPAVYKLRIEM